VRFKVDRDQAGAVCLVSAAERATGIRKGIGGAGRRLVVVVVVGTSKVAANLRLTRGGNRAFITQCAAWLRDWTGPSHYPLVPNNGHLVAEGTPAKISQAGTVTGRFASLSKATTPLPPRPPRRANRGQPPSPCAVPKNII
jgi:hypothetical protein